MKVLLTFCILVSLGTAAQARLTPQHRQAPDNSPDVWAIYTGPVGAMLASDYLEPLNGVYAAQRLAPCQMLRNTVNGEIQITHSCH